MTTIGTRIRFPRPDQAVLDWIEENRSPDPRPNLMCEHCTHAWHGIRCSSCCCVTSSIPVDDTWRTHRTWAKEVKMLQLMTDTGCDGWTARAVLANQDAGEGSNIRAALLGRTQ